MNSKKAQIVDLCAGTGGLSFGFAKAGARKIVKIENDQHSCNSLNANAGIFRRLKTETNLLNADAQSIDPSSLGRCDVLVGGPPCQPFSLAGKRNGNADKRDLTETFADFLSVLQPKAFVFENVPGLTVGKLNRYFFYLKYLFRHPELKRKKSENWNDHMSRLELHDTGSKAQSSLRYSIYSRVLNSADYGIPQVRKRLFMVGYIEGLCAPWAFPKGNYSLHNLAHEKWVTREYWKQHKITRNAYKPTQVELQSLKNITDAQLVGKRWRTVRDVINDLGDMPATKRVDKHYGHYRLKGAKSYKGHTGSLPDVPSKTIKAGVNGVPGGENMLRNYNGKVRYFSLRECARIQTFPDDYIFVNSLSQDRKLIGNAVPPELSYIIAKSVLKALNLT